MTDLSPAAQLRAAAARLTQPGAPILVAPRLQQPLAELLESVAQFASLYADLSRASGVEPTEKDHDKTVRAALAVARAILDDAPPDGPTPPQTAADTPGASSDAPTAPAPPQAHTADPGTGLSVQLDDALWDAIAVPGPKEPTFVQQHQRVCRVVAEHLQALATAQDEDMRGRTVYTCPGETVPAELRERLTQAIDKARIWHATDGTGTWGYTDAPAITNAVLAALDHTTAPDTGLREQYAAAMREHWLNLDGEPDADHNFPCFCGDWREGPDEDWDDHLADAVLAVRDHAMQQLRAERDGAYRERAHLIALLATMTEGAVIAPAPDIDEPDWQIAYLTLGGWQCSWHIAPSDAALFARVEHVPADDPRAQWDGHTTDVKYRRIRTHTSVLALRLTDEEHDEREAQANLDALAPLRVYVSGPYSADPERSIQAAIRAADQLLTAGHAPLVPHLKHPWITTTDHSYEAWLGVDLAWLQVADAVLRLPGHSPGADRETAVAHQLGIPVHHNIQDLLAGA
jgi:hypothetical protein